MSRRADRLSDLPDDLLLRILRFAPAKEAASTRALSRRWRSSLWRSSGAVNLETRIENYRRFITNGGWHGGGMRENPDKALFFSRRDAFVSAAEAALDAADVPVTRLTLLLEYVGDKDSVNMFLYRDSDDWWSPDRDVLLVRLLSHQAARRVEELRLTAKQWSRRTHACKEDDVTPLYPEGMFTLCLGSLPSETLRVLELTACNVLVPLPRNSAAVFLRLSSLRLCHCTARIDALQSLVDAAPALAAIHLESVTITQQRHSESFSDYYVDDTGPPPSTETVQLCCPAATVLVLNNVAWIRRYGYGY
jgi:hypothetical protein